MQPERTALAWRRTALVLTAAALAALRFLPAIIGAWTIVPVALGLSAAVSVFVFAHHRHVSTHDVLTTAGTDRVPLPSGRLLAVVAAAVTTYGIAVLAAVLVFTR